MNSYRKVKTVSKDIYVKGPKLEKIVLNTMKIISDVVGSTLGPGGCPVLIERQEYGLPNIVTKDGVTVFRHMGFTDPTQHALMESARDAATRTVSEAGDGTTTATVLSEAIVRYTSEFCKNNPKVSPQKVLSRLERLFKTVIEPKIKEWSIIPDNEMLHGVAKISANGDSALADAIMKCFDYVGDDGNISIVEQNGPSGYSIEELKGFPVNIGYEDSCGKFGTLFMNDSARNRCYLEKPVFVLYYGSIGEPGTIEMLMESIGEAWENPAKYGLSERYNHNVVLVATGFSELVLGNLSVNFKHPKTINVFPMVVPKFPTENGQLQFLMDLAAVVGATVFDPISKPLEKATLADLKYGEGVDSFEAGRYRSTILGLADETLVIARAEEVKNSLVQAESTFDSSMIQERIAKLTNGIAKLIVSGPSSAELREKRDRAEDATFAVRGAKKFGCLPGGCWALVNICSILEATLAEDPISMDVLKPALCQPLTKLLTNCGLNSDECTEILSKIGRGTDFTVYDAMEGEFVEAIAGGILDATPAVLEAVRNSISAAKFLGTLGATIVHQRDAELERNESMSVNDFVNSIEGA